MIYNYEIRRNAYAYSRKFGAGTPSFAPFTYGYPSSFPGVNIFEAGELDKILGMTDGKVIVLKRGLKELKDFVLFHEEEHVKDMTAGEMEIDRRALRRMKLSGKLAKDMPGKITELMEMRWDTKAADLLKELE